MVLLVRAAIHQDQRVLEEDLAADGAGIEEGPPRPDGSRPVRARATQGAISVGYDALVAVDGAGRACPADDAPLAAPEEADFALMEWTLPSRYCPSDALAPTATAEFGDRPRTRALIPAVASWVRERIDYVPGSSDALTAADETLLRRQGVCRDMAHLAVALLRALEVPGPTRRRLRGRPRAARLPRPARGPRRRALAPGGRHRPGAGGDRRPHRRRP